MCVSEHGSNFQLKSIVCSADGVVLAYAAADYSIGLLDARTLAVSPNTAKSI